MCYIADNNDRSGPFLEQKMAKKKTAVTSNKKVAPPSLIANPELIEALNKLQKSASAEQRKRLKSKNFKAQFISQVVGD